MAILQGCIKGGTDILRRDERLDVVNRSKDEAATWRGSSMRRLTLLVDLIWRAERSTCWVSTPPPQKNDIPAVFLFQPPGVHAMRET
jgi:hypothetical protein